MQMKVGIVQNGISYGGRLTVIVQMIASLNKRGIVPDIIVFRSKITPEGVKEKYGLDINFRIRKIAHFLPRIKHRIPHEINMLAFNLALKRICHQYNYFIDSNNTSFLMPADIPIFSYVHFPRIARLKSKYMSIHHPDGPRKRWICPEGFCLKTLGLVYSFHSISDNNFLTANSQFTKANIKQYYPAYNKEIPVIYPPVYTGQKSPKKFEERDNNICSVGRFCRDKRQFEQIKLAQKLPDWNFHLIGFANEKCLFMKRLRKYIETYNIKNVFLHLNVSKNEKENLLQRSKFFIHPNINEPFGITTVEGISNGCIPLVHNSGGQKEIVPFEKLRFDEIEDLDGFFEEMKDSDEKYVALLSKLVEHCRNESSLEKFSERFGKCLNYFEKNYL